jgi:hypothetical protein
MVSNLVNLSVGIKLAMDSCPLEAPDLKERLNVVEDMLRECMGANSMDAEENVLVAVEDRHIRNREDYSAAIHRARALIQGPLRLCLKHRLIQLLGTRQVNIIVSSTCSLVLDSSSCADYDICERRV